MTDTDTLRVHLAEALDWQRWKSRGSGVVFLLNPTEKQREYWSIFNSRTDEEPTNLSRVPSLESLIRTAEQGLREEQKRAYAIRRVLNVGYFLERGPELSPDDIFKLITETDDRKAAALVEVLKGGRS